MKSIVFFNNKGGVGKTTLVCNIASFLSMHRNKHVLLIDADPQCNATQAILDDSLCDNIYLSKTSKQHTILDVLQPIENGYPDISTQISPLLGSTNKYNIDLIPGHPGLSMLEDRLSRGWTELLSGEIGGFKITNWSTQLLSYFSNRYDLILFDVGPSLGALNRTTILSSDYFVAPLGCDIFSILGITNISSWIQRWTDDYNQSLDIAGRRGRTDSLSDSGVLLDLSHQFRFVGYSVQQYVSRKFKDGPRPVKAYDNIMRDIPDTVRDKLSFLAPASLDMAQLPLADIPYVYSLVPLSQANKTPIHALGKSDGLAGSQYKQVNDYKDLIQDFSSRLLGNLV